MPSDPYTQAEIVTALGQQADDLHLFFRGVPADRFFMGTETRWAPAHHAQHLVQTVRPLAAGLPWPVLVTALQRARPLAERLRAPGWTKGPPKPRTYTQIRRDYQQVLRQGARAPARYVPRLRAGHTQDRLARSVQVSILNLQAALRGWDECRLDTLWLPHPLLGLLSIREMMFFTLYHNSHHVLGVQQLLG